MPGFERLQVERSREAITYNHCASLKHLSRLIPTKLLVCLKQNRDGSKLILCFLLMLQRDRHPGINKPAGEHYAQHHFQL